MSSKEDSWQLSLKSIANKIFGIQFDKQSEIINNNCKNSNNKNETYKQFFRKQQVNQPEKIRIIKQNKCDLLNNINYYQNQKIQLNPNFQFTSTSSTIYHLTNYLDQRQVISLQKSNLLKQKWRILMKFSLKTKYNQTLQLLKTEGSIMQDQIWIWMIKNSQKISPKLYNIKKQEYYKVIYQLKERNINSLNNLNKNRNYAYLEHNQIQDFVKNYQVEPTFFIKNSKKYFLQSNQLNCENQKKRKASISKSSNFIYNGSTNSQCSTFSSQTNNYQSSIDYNSNSKSKINIIDMNNLNDKGRQAFRNNNTFEEDLQSHQSMLYMIPSTVNHPVLSDIIGSFLIHRPDMNYSITLFNMAATFFYYTNSHQIKTFTLLCNVAGSQFYVYYLSGCNQAIKEQIQFIVAKIKKNIPSTVFMKNIQLQYFIQNWLFSFFYSFCQNGTQMKQKIIGYLLMNQFTILSLVHVCQSIINSLKRYINQANQQIIIDCLNFPKKYIDKEIFYENLFEIKV